MFIKETYPLLTNNTDLAEEKPAEKDKPTWLMHISLEHPGYMFKHPDTWQVIKDVNEGQELFITSNGGYFCVKNIKNDSKGGKYFNIEALSLDFVNSYLKEGFGIVDVPLHWIKDVAQNSLHNGFLMNQNIASGIYNFIAFDRVTAQSIFIVQGGEDSLFVFVFSSDIEAFDSLMSEAKEVLKSFSLFKHKNVH